MARRLACVVFLMVLTLIGIEHHDDCPISVKLEAAPNLRLLTLLLNAGQKPQGGPYRLCDAFNANH